ncbi:MAG: ATP phosphoribosyltransferase regulatory subunit, partial [Candidatus Micrarchaeota archaeon]
MAEFQTPKGMRDYFGKDAILRERMLEAIKGVYKRWGYEPLTTPAIEMGKTLGAKAGDEIAGQLFKIEDSEYALRFDLTVGTARFAANSNMPKPYKRYCIAPVWRREEPQKGRLREFLQADADIIGSAEMKCEAELLAMACAALRALG